MTTERETNKIRIFSLPDLTPIDGGGIAVFEGETERDPMGVSLYTRPTDGVVFAIVGRKVGPSGTYMWQYQLTGNDSGVVTANVVRKFGQFSGKKEIEAIAVDADKYHQDFNLKIKDQKKDSLKITAVQSGTLNFRERFTLETATPLVRFDNSKIKLTNTVEAIVPFTTEYDEFNQLLYFDFKKEPSQKYTFTILPEALTDFYEKSNDTLIFKTNTKSESDYGNLIVNLEKVKKFFEEVE